MANKQTDAQLRYDSTHTTRFFLKLNNIHDADIIAKLNGTLNKQGYIKELIRRDMAGKKDGKRV